jgi:hypothetical protein
LGPLGTADTNRPIVPASGDYDDGEIARMIGRGNRSTRRKPVPVSLCPPQTSHACPDANPGRRGGKPAGRPRGRISSPGRVKNFLFSTSSRSAPGSTQSQWVPVVKRPGREADHSPPASAEMKKMWLYTSTPQYAYRDNFTFFTSIRRFFVLETNCPIL